MNLNRTTALVALSSVTLVVVIWGVYVSTSSRQTSEHGASETDAPKNPSAIQSVSFAESVSASGADGQHLPACFQAPLFLRRPHPTTDRTEWIMWRRLHPFSVILGKEELGRIQSSKYSAAFNIRSKKAREEDLWNGENTEAWEWQNRIKAKSESLFLQQSAREVLELLGEPALMIRHWPTLDGNTLVLNKTYDTPPLKKLSAVDLPFSYRYQPEGWDRMRRHNHHLRKLQIDFTVDGKLFQWSFNPLPNSPDW